MKVIRDRLTSDVFELAVQRLDERMQRPLSSMAETMGKRNGRRRGRGWGSEIG